MWNLMMDDLLRRLTVEGIAHVAYADDLLLVINAESRASIETGATAAMEHVLNWGRTVGVEVSPTKTVAMMLRGRLDPNRPPIIRTRTIRLDVVRSVKYLGVWLTPGMRFDLHLRETAEKLQKVIAPLKRVLRKEWGLNQRACATWIKGLMAPVTLYASAVWHDRVRKGKLESIQRMALYATLRVCRTVSTKAMQVLACSVPWDLEAIRLSVRHKMRRGIPLSEGDLISNEESTRRDAIDILDTRIHGEWQRRWTTADVGRTTHSFIPNVVDCYSGFDPSMRTSFLLTGHGSLNSYLFKIAQEPLEECICGWRTEDWEHVLGFCVIYHDLRNLAAMGVRVEGQRLDVSRALDTKEQFAELTRFAEQAFRRRETLIRNE